MRALCIAWLAACSTPRPTIEIEPAEWRLVQRTPGPRIVGDARLSSGPALFLERRDTSVLRVDPIPSQRALGEEVRIRVTVREDAPDAAYRVVAVDRSSDVRFVGTDRLELGRGESGELVVSSDRPGCAQIRLGAVPMGGRR
jgi:hypothetical protein